MRLLSPSSASVHRFFDSERGAPVESYSLISKIYAMQNYARRAPSELTSEHPSSHLITQYNEKPSISTGYLRITYRYRQLGKMESPLSNHSHNSILSVIFDPFMIGPDHAKHIQSSSIVNLEESRKIFCPLCLESVSIKEIESLEEELFDQYVKNLFEALDQHSEKDKLRKIVVKMLEIILSRRTIIVKSESDFHNFLRIILKTMKSERFNNLEFASMARILSLVLAKFAKPLPLVPIWRVMEYTINFGTAELDKLSQDYINTFNMELCRFFGSLSSLIQTYLHMLIRFGNDKISDAIFPIFQDDTPQTVGSKYYESSKRTCLRFMIKSLFPKCWKNLSNNEMELSDAEKIMAGELFGALSECHKTAVRLKDREYSTSLEKLDYLKISHSLIYKNTDKKLRQNLRNFLKDQVSYYVRHYFNGDDADKHFEEYIESPDIVETNHKNAMIYSSDSQKYKRTLFYLLINCVALKQSSNYFVLARVKKVLKIADPAFMGVDKSSVLVRAYNFLAAHATSKVSSYEVVSVFTKQIWKKMLVAKNFDKFIEDFCFDENVFYWAYDHEDFIKLVRSKAIAKIFEISELNKVQALLRLLENTKYRNLVRNYFSKEDNASGVIEDVIQYDLLESPTIKEAGRLQHENQISELSALLLPLFNQSILDAINNYRIQKLQVIRRIANILVVLMENCDHFEFMLNDQEIKDLFRLIEIMYKSIDEERADDTLIALNNFIAQLMKTNHPSLMRILNKLDYSILGYMFSRLADYTKEDYLSESIAHVLITYDNIDYPLVQDISRNLHPMALSVLNWMLSQNNDLHILSLMLAQKVLSTNISQSTKTCVTTGLIHMLVSNPQILDKKIHLDMFLSIVDRDEFKYNPLIKHVLVCIESKSVKAAINQKLEAKDEDRPLSPTPSFESDDSSNFGEEQRMTITQILDQLHDEENQTTDNVPDNLYISNEHISYHRGEPVDVGEWEETALEASQMAEPF